MDIPPLPEEFRRETLGAFPDGGALLRAIESGQAHAGLRLNPLKPCAIPWELPPIPWEPNGRYYAPEMIRPGQHPLHAAGAYYLQEPSAMLPATMLCASPGERVLDLCAAPGGKSGQLAASMGNSGLLMANEIDPKRARALVQNLERLGVGNAIVTNQRPDALAARFPEGFDAILVDAPCSGEGMFRREPASRREWSESLPAACAKRQLAILGSAAMMLRPGGRMVYSTCTFNHTENEQVVQQFLDAHPDFALTEVRHLLPHIHPGEGHFAAKMVRSGDEPARAWPPLPQMPLGKAWEEFSRENLRMEDPPARGIAQGEWLCIPPKGAPALDGLRPLRVGVQIARIRKDRVEPAHALAMSLKAESAAHALDVSVDDALRYLRGEALPHAAGWKGWALVTHQGLPLGWGKASEGWVKNHLPKGLRMV